MFITSLFSPFVGGGAEVTIQALVEALAERGHDVLVLTLGPNAELSDSTNSKGVRIVRIPHQNIYWHFDCSGEPKFRKVFWHTKDSWNSDAANIAENWIERFRPDALSLHNLSGWSPAVWRDLSRARGVRVVQVLHDLYSLCIRSTMYSPKSGVCVRQCAQCMLLRRRAKFASNRVNAVVGISEFILQRHIALGMFQTATQKAVIHNRRPPLQLNVLDFRGPTSRTKALRLGFFGTMKEHKGALWLVNALRTQPTLNISLSIAGDGDPLYIAQVTDALDVRMSYIGRTDPRDFYPSIDVLIVPSLWDEPLGMVVAEASIYGCVSLVRQSGGLPELIVPGENGHTFQEASDLLSLIEQLELNRGMVAGMASKAVSIAEEFTDVDGWARKYEGVYSS